MNSPIDLDSRNVEQRRALATQLMTQVDEKNNEIRFKDARIAQLTHEMAVLKRSKAPRVFASIRGKARLLDPAHSWLA